MQNVNTSLLSTICEIPGAPGFENQIRAFIQKELQPLNFNSTIDNLGNLTYVIPGKSNTKVMVAAHMDEIGFMVTHIDDKGFLKFHTLGGFDPKTLTAQRVIVHGKKDLIGVMGAKPIHVMNADERNKPANINDFFIDLGMPKEEVEKWIEIGNPVTRERALIEMGDCVNCKSLDNRVSVYILIEALKKIQGKEFPFEVHAVFTVQEEVGIRGAQVAALNINPDFGICIDTTIAFDTPGAAAHEKITSLGEGVAIKIMDSRTICDTRMVEFMKNQATQNNIKFQTEVLTAGGTDTSAIQQMTAGGAISGAISIPTRHIHQVIEMCHKQDILNAIDLLVTCLTNLDSLK
jgi:endoglucanase